MKRFSIIPNLLPKEDPRYKRWRERLKRRPPPWCKGYTKETHPSIAKMVKTFKRKKIDNFRNWRKKMQQLGKWPAAIGFRGSKIIYSPLKKSGDLAELIGVILGDGNIYKHPRTEELRISSNSEDKEFIKRYERLVAKIFKKKPKLEKVKNSNCIYIRIYQKDMSERLGIPLGSRRDQQIRIPRWILKNKIYLIKYLRGLYEAEGSFCVHIPTYTYKFLFRNKNKSLLRNVYNGLKILGFHPHRSRFQIQISKKKEVYKIKDLIKFRQY
jgi:hypothetical protein